MDECKHLLFALKKLSETQSDCSRNGEENEESMIGASNIYRDSDSSVGQYDDGDIISYDSKSLKF